MKPVEIKNLLAAIGFSETSKQIHEKKWSQHGGYEISVDFGKKKINYPKPIELGDSTTSNLSHDENMVVLECVCRLLDKGYKPESLTLEKRWPTGRGASGGKSDINITSLDGKLLLIIECKTWGSEFEKEQTKMVKNGGQLFSYLQHDHNTQFLCLYASKLDKTEVQYENSIVRIKDDQKLVEQFDEGDSEIRLYREAKNKDDFYQAWFENTSCYFHPNGIFDDDAQPYNIELQPLKHKDLKPFKSGDGGFIHNQFAEILRHNNISDKENAFNKMISLFLCKVVDESKDINEVVDFQWKEGIDTYEDLQDRLQKLYHIGMKEYLQEEIIYFENDYVDKAFRYHKKAVAKDKMTAMLKALKFYSNNEFAFKEVHNQRLFSQNAKVVNEVIQLLQRYRFKYNNKQQFLGNLFELLLNDGVKQSEGQFFTPIPIARLIVSSMPITESIEQKMNNSEVKILPRVIDYACGSGHFLTEAIDEIQQAIEKHGIIQYQGSTSWTRDCIYGVEKDYRLSRTAKIACFLNGAGDANILYEDGLEQHPDLGEKESFDILIANPPYSIKDFKQHLHLKYNEFELLNGLSDSASEIETLFVERIVQLLKAGGMAGVILPSSILSNSGVYTRAREMLLKNFFIRSVVELGSNTFIATSTNTVVLFLEKRGDEAAAHYQYRVEGLFENPGSLTHKKQCIDFDDEYLLKAYCQHHKIEVDDYRSLMNKEPTQGLMEHEHYQSYKSWFDGITETKNLKKQAVFIRKSKPDQQTELNRRFWLRVHEREKERLFYFALAYGQNVVTVKSGEKQAEKEFLGYEWSKRRGHEGMKAIGDGKLVDMNDYNNPQKVNSYIRKNFLQQSIDSVDDDIKEHVSQAELINMLEFDRFDFNKRIDLIAYPDPSLEYTKYEIKRLNEDLIDEVLDSKRKPVTKRDRKSGNYPYYGATGEVDKIDKYIFDEKLVLIGEDGAKWQALENSAFIVDGKYWVNNHAHVIKPNRAKLIDEYLIVVLNVFDLRKYVTGWNNVPKLNQGNLLSIKIPLPPKQIQQKIIKEIQEIEQKGVSYSSIDNAQHEIYLKKKSVLDKHLK